jgi:tRNA(Ile)-lysidine synthase
VKAPVPFLDHVRSFCRRLPAGNRSFLVAVSGGPDSVALLRALVQLQRELEIEPLVVAHLNHQLRGDESAADQVFVSDLCADFHLRFRTTTLAVADLVHEEGGNLESVARRTRYEWLSRVGEEEKLRYVATGHTADDQAETVLHHLLRGTGLRGLRGIAAKRKLSGATILVRPLLRVTRTQVVEFLQSLSQQWRHDSSNTNLSFTRNRIRQELLPHLAERYNPTVALQLGRLAGQAAEFYRWVAAAGRRLVAEAERPRAGTLLIFDRQRLTEAPRFLVREALRSVWRREGWPQNGMTCEAWDRLAAVALGEITACDFPGIIRARCRERVIQIGPSEPFIQSLATD